MRGFFMGRILAVEIDERTTRDDGGHFVSVQFFPEGGRTVIRAWCSTTDDAGKQLVAKDVSAAPVVGLTLDVQAKLNVRSGLPQMSARVVEAHLDVDLESGEIMAEARG